MGESLNSLLRELRKSSGRSLREAARQIQVDPAYLSRVERGEKPVSKSVQQRLAAYYDVEPEVVAVASGDIPADIAAILRTHPEAIAELRKRYGAP